MHQTLRSGISYFFLSSALIHMLSIEKTSGEGFINGGGFGNLESRDTIPLRSVALNLQNPVNETEIDVKKDPYIYMYMCIYICICILFFCVIKFIH